MMKQEKPDDEKLIRVASEMRFKLKLPVEREPILLFHPDDGRLVRYSTTFITEEEFHFHKIHVPDLLTYLNGELWLIEVDGWIHDTKQSVEFKDIERNECYKTANINFFIVNEKKILEDKGIKLRRPANVGEVYDVIEKKIRKILSKK